MYLEALAGIIQDEGVATIGSNLFVYSAPAEQENYALLMLGGDGIPFDSQLPGYYNTKYQVIVRYKTHAEGAAFANDIKDALYFYGKTKGGIIFKHSIPKDEPRPFRRNEAGIIEFSNNFLISFVKQ